MDKIVKHSSPKPLRQSLTILSLALAAGMSVLAQPDNTPGLVDLPEVAQGFEVKLFAKEPIVRNPCSMAFDAKGRMFVGMGPQYRNPKPDTAPDSVMIVLDTDGDGIADKTKVFATGFNCIQGLAWHGRDLWVANSPDLTIVRDLDGDDEADEYVLVYTDLGNIEHALHGLNWAPDGKLYMSKGNSKGLNLPDRYAPKPFREIWGMPTPAGAVDFPEPRVFKKGEYEHAYHNPSDDWGRSGGVLRCDDLGKNLEIVSRGFRNPWDITFDSGLNFIGTDNDQDDGDRIFMPFYGADFGWSHAWSSHWTGKGHLPTAPISGPVFTGSGTGTIFYDATQFPENYRNAYFINDWLHKKTYVYRPTWDGALLQPENGKWEEFIVGTKALFRPTDIEVGPDGALYSLGWGREYGVQWDANQQMANEGRVFRIASKIAPLIPRSTWYGAKRDKPVAKWTVAELIADLAGPLPVWRVNAQDELVRRGAAVKLELREALLSGKLSEAQETWAAWALGRIAPGDPGVDQYFLTNLYDRHPASLNLRVQSARILGQRAKLGGKPQSLPKAVAELLKHKEPRLRFEAAQAIWQAKQLQFVPALKESAATETDRLTYYTVWHALRDLTSTNDLKASLKHKQDGVRRAALLALLDLRALSQVEVAGLEADADADTRELAKLWLAKTATGGEKPQLRGRPLDGSSPSPSRETTKSESNRGAEQAKDGLIANLRADSKERYRLPSSALKAGAVTYTDRQITFKEVPEAVAGARYVQTANNDAGSSGGSLLKFEARLPVTIYLGHDVRLSARPQWMKVGQPDGFTPTDLVVQSTDTSFRLFRKEFAAGEVVLGGNNDEGREGGCSAYLVLYQPVGMKPLATPTTIAQALTALAKGKPERGEQLFFNGVGLACFNCHRVSDRGNKFGPELTDIGSGNDPNYIVQSILEPNAIIKEGFSGHDVETSDGDYSGTLVEETDFILTLAQASGQPLRIEKSKIKKHTTSRNSPMPSFAELLAPEQVADLAAWLMLQKPGAVTLAARSVGDGKREGRGNGFSSLAAAEASSSGESATVRGDGFAFEPKPDRLIITHRGQPVAHYIWKDEKILRPFFAHLHAPDGVQVSRNFPPIPGKDSTDHADLHPGLWLGFGDISGNDYWRNKAAIQHDRFIEAPAVRDGKLRFATENSVLTKDGKLLCKLINRVTLASRPAGYLLILEASFKSDDSDFAFGDQEEMGFGIRVATSITEKNGGTIRNSAGATTAKATWGKPGEWCDYSGTMDNRLVGATIMPDPKNFRPSWWHNRDYGVFVANSFGRKAMKQGEVSSVEVKKGETFRIRFGALLHSSPVDKPVDLGAAYQDFLAQ